MSRQPIRLPRYIKKLNPELSPCEKEAVALLCEGHNDESIANQRDVSVQTVKRQLAMARKRKQCSSRLELAIAVLREQFAEELQRARNEAFDMQSN